MSTIGRENGLPAQETDDQRQYRELREKIRQILTQLSQTSEYQDYVTTNGFSKEKHLRALGQALHDRILPEICDSNIKMEQAILLLHEILTPFWEEVAEDYDFLSGSYRSNNVQVGDNIPLRFDHAQETMSQFSRTLENLMDEAEFSDTNILAVWAYVVLQAIHPFQDGTGRVGRGLIDLVRFKLCKKFNVPFGVENFYSQEENETGIATSHKVTEVLDGLSLSGTLRVLDIGISGERFRNLLQAAGLEHWYFRLIRFRMQKHLSSIASIEDVRALRQLVSMVDELRPIRHEQRYRTRPLLAVQGSKTI